MRMLITALLWCVVLPSAWAGVVCQPLVIQHSKVVADQPNYVLTVSDTDSHLATAANGGYVRNSNGNDIVFSSDSTGQTLLKWDPLESYDPATGRLTVHVSTGPVSSTADTIIYRCAGGSASDFQGGAAGTAWSSAYSGVYHFGDGTTLNAIDATGQHNGTVNGATAAAGQIGGAATITGSSSISLPQGLAFPFSLEAWVKIPGATGVPQVIVTIPGTYNGGNIYLDASGYLIANYGGQCVAGPNPFPTGAWVHIGVTLAGSGGPCKLYQNGSQVASGTMINQSQGIAGSATLGSIGTSLPLSGLLDEVRLYSGVLSGSGIATDYNNQSNPTAFYVPGPWSATGRSGGTQVCIF